MTSAARVSANQRNAQKSIGPRSSEGKRRAAGNALRHGLTVPIVAIPELDATERLAQLIADGDRDPGRVSLAGRIAEAETDLARVRHACHEHLREMCGDPVHWLRATVVQFPFSRKVAAAMPEAAAVRLLQAAGTGRIGRDLRLWGQRLSAIDRYERRALSRRNSAVRLWRERWAFPKSA